MITEEAGLALTHKPSHWAQSPKLSPGTQVKDFVIFREHYAKPMIIYPTTTKNRVKHGFLSSQLKRNVFDIV